MTDKYYKIYTQRGTGICKALIVYGTEPSTLRGNPTTKAVALGPQHKLKCRQKALDIFHKAAIFKTQKQQDKHWRDNSQIVLLELGAGSSGRIIAITDSNHEVVELA